MTTQVEEKAAIQRLVWRYYISKEVFEEGPATNPDHNEMEFVFERQIEDLINEILEYRFKWDELKKN